MSVKPNRYSSVPLTYMSYAVETTFHMVPKHGSPWLDCRCLLPRERSGATLLINAIPDICYEDYIKTQIRSRRGGARY